MVPFRPSRKGLNYYSHPASILMRQARQHVECLLQRMWRGIAQLLCNPSILFWEPSDSNLYSFMNGVPGEKKLLSHRYSFTR